MSVVKSLETEAANLVERSRLGDQNATAMIQMVAKGAAAGKSKAQAAFTAIQNYIEKNPHVAPVAAKMSGDTEYQQMRVALANGPRIGIGEVMGLAAQFGVEHPAGYKAFTFGYANFGMPKVLATVASKYAPIGAYIKAGAMMAYARALQNLRTAGGKISSFSKNIGWELGE